MFSFLFFVFFFSSRRRHTRCLSDWSSDVCSSDLGGMFFCVDAESGKTLWTSEPKQGDNAVVLISGDLLFLLKNNAELIVAKRSEERRVGKECRSRWSPHD